MRTSDVGIALIKKYESLRLDAYQDSKGVWTIGWGNIGKDATPGNTITEERAEELLRLDLNGAEADVSQLLDRRVDWPLTQPQFDALVSFQFNTGALSNPKNMIVRRINACEDDQVDSEMRRWCNITKHGMKIKLAGLVARRNEEAELWLSGCEQHDAVYQESETQGTTVPDAVPPPSIGNSSAVRTATGLSGAAVIAQVAQQLQPLSAYSDTIKQVFLVVSLAVIVWTAIDAWNGHGRTA